MQATKIGQQNRVQAVLNEKVGGEQGVAGFLSGAQGLAKELQSSKVAVSLVGLPGPRAFLENLRDGLIGQASTSRDVSLLAVSHLLERDGKPANGGLEIPWTGKGVGGARTKSRAQIELQLQRLESKVAQLERSLRFQRSLIDELAKDMIEEKPRSAAFCDFAVDMNREHGTSENLMRRIGDMNREIAELKRLLS